MKSSDTRISRILLITWLLFGLPATAHAYLDPGTGSFVLQMLVAGFLGTLFYIKMTWQSIKMFFGRLFHGRNKASAQATTEDDNP